MQHYLNGEILANKSEETHKSLNKWPSGGVFVIGQEQVDHITYFFFKKKKLSYILLKFLF